eukprot:CAMPEP_0169461148 /NCGR_PEP_ID=MMETSP1042-20121227/18872_1 /TAXON_ID=464988 /ORGANISM="Hemiselmis andersenii, Strain CCMP1180" /LENGTH=279 /DNA_ID=CAMNT_0009573699 /DNA_START=18 /DNA_END=857 /DNA_ORIENTATION=-
MKPSASCEQPRPTAGAGMLRMAGDKAVPPSVRGEVPCQDADFAHVPNRPSEVPIISTPLRNRYFALRHGQSEANVDNIISSLPARGTTIHGLTGLGRLQAQQSAPHLLEVIGDADVDKILFCSSNFTRARQTAEEAAAALKELLKETKGSAVADQLDTSVTIIEPLRERWFGELDNTIITNYNMVWPADLKDAQCVQYGVESVDECCKRLSDMILQLEGAHEGREVVLTSHADTLQILQSYLARQDPRQFSQFRFKNGEVRRLLQDSSAMPDPVPLTYA